MASKKEQKAFEEVAGIIGDLLRQAVAATISDPAPEPARHCTGSEEAEAGALEAPASAAVASPIEASLTTRVLVLFSPAAISPSSPPRPAQRPDWLRLDLSSCD